MAAFLAVAVLMALVAVLVVAIPLVRTAQARAPVAALLAALAIPAAALVLYALVSNFPWAAPPPAVAGAAPDTPEIIELKQRTTAQPADVDAWSRLGDAYLASERFREAKEAYRQAIVASNGGDDALRLAFAEASILEDPGALRGEAGTIIDDVLSRDPFNARALWYGGMAALGRGDSDTARQRWRQLLDLGPPPQVRQIIEQQLAGLGAATAGTGEAGGAPAGGPGIPVHITLDPALAGRVKPGAVLFLIAREAGGAGGPPLAAVRRAQPQLPLDLQIGDADSMMPGGLPGGRKALQFIARLSASGDVKAASGDVYGEASWQAGGGAGQPVQIVINQLVP